jgi:hypothetical protein
MNYLDNVQFNLVPEFSARVRSKILELLTKKLKIKKMIANIKKNVADMCYTYDEGNWTTCKKKCQVECEKQARLEIKSTAYNLKCIADSMIPNKGLVFNFDIFYIDNLTGIWKEDKKYFGLINPEPFKDPRLILALGPSGCGKTEWSTKLINILSSIREYPSRFLCIDEALYRNASIVCNAIHHTANQLCYKGFDNLFLSEFSLFKKNIFDSSRVKDQIVSYLKSQQRISLYVPESLSKCGSSAWSLFWSCNSLVNKYVDITRDKEYIAFLIYQHENENECDLQEMYKCAGCLESGKNKEKSEGKKFISKYYNRSIKNSKVQLDKSPFKFIIHNSGRKGYLSVIRDENENKNNIFSRMIKINQDRFSYTYTIKD